MIRILSPTRPQQRPAIDRAGRRRRHAGLLALLALLALAPLGATPQPLQRDLVLLLDNSGSMKKNDPDFLTGQAVADYIAALPGGTRAAVALFDAKVRLAAPLTELDPAGRQRLLASLEQLDYRGRFTDSAAALERAIYELKSNARPGADKSILFLTDGIVDVGDPARDLELARWLREDLAAAAAQEGIRVYSVAFTEHADFLLVQSLARRTGGDYLRIMSPAELPAALRRFDAIATRVARPRAVEPQAQEPPAAPAGQPTATDAPAAARPALRPDRDARASAPAPRRLAAERDGTPAAQEERALALSFAAAGLLLVAASAGLWLMRRRRRNAAAAAPVAPMVPPAQPRAPPPEALLKDISGANPGANHKLGARPVLIGRAPAPPEQALDSVLIQRDTIGRRHALIEYRNCGYWIADQRSVNGTYLNGKRVAGRRRLKHGDRIRFHQAEFEFLTPELEQFARTRLASPARAGGEITATVARPRRAGELSNRRLIVATGTTATAQGDAAAAARRLPALAAAAAMPAVDIDLSDDATPADGHTDLLTTEPYEAAPEDDATARPTSQRRTQPYDVDFSTGPSSDAPEESAGPELQSPAPGTGRPDGAADARREGEESRARAPGGTSRATAVDGETSRPTTDTPTEPYAVEPATAPGPVAPGRVAETGPDSPTPTDRIERPTSPADARRDGED